MTAGADTGSVDAVLVSGAGSISGLVVSQAGQGYLSKFCISAMNGSGTTVASTQSGAFFFNLNNTNYVIYGLSASGGPYKIRFDSCGGAAGSWVTQWYDDASSFGAANAVAVASSTNTPNINAGMVAIAEVHAGPNRGPTAGHTVVTLSGSGFTGATSVTFGGVAGTSLNVASDSLLTVTSPAHVAGTVLITVVTPSGRCSNATAVAYTYVAAPKVAGISPNKGPTGGGTLVTITGTNLAGATAVHFGSVAAHINSIVSATKIVVTSPKGTGTVDVTVTTAGGTSAKTSADRFTY